MNKKFEGIIQDIKDYVYCKIKIDSIQNMKLRLSKEYFPENIKVGNMITIEYKNSNKLIEPVIHVK